MSLGATVIQDLDATLRQLLTTGAPAGSLLASAAVAFDLPDAAWQAKLSALTLNLYLTDISENRDMRTNGSCSFAAQMPSVFASVAADPD